MLFCVIFSILFLKLDFVCIFSSVRERFLFIVFLGRVRCLLNSSY